MSWWTKLWGGRDRGSEIEEVKALSDQFYITLSAMALKVQSPEGERRQAVADRVKALLDPSSQGEWSWNRAYEVEQQLVYLYDEASLETEIGRRLIEAESLKKPLVDWYREQVDEVSDDGRRRALLLRLINDIQWRYTVKEAARNYTRQITERTGWLFMGAMVVFVTSLLVVILYRHLPQSGAYLLLASAAGLWGAAFSMLTGLKGRLAASTFDQLKLARSWSMILARVLLGSGAAVVLYLFMRSGLLAGEAFPTLAGDAASGGADPLPIPRDVKTLALLTVWCFIAGFSEKLVPGLLSKTEAAAADQAEPATGRVPTIQQPAAAAPPPPAPEAAGSPATGAPATGGGGGASKDK